MIVVDTSAVMAILQREEQAPVCMSAITGADNIIVSAGTLAELLIVAGRRGIAAQAEHFMRELDIEIVSVTARSARQAADAYERWGKGLDPAGLNLGDCFAYALAKDRNCPLLFVGRDFAKTDIQPAATGS